MITREADYAVRTVLHLTRKYGGEGRVRSRELADEMEIPYRFFRKLVGRLVDAGLVRSRRGRDGGLLLGRPPDNISLLDVLNAMDPNGVKLNLCLSDARLCGRSGLCPVHDRLVGLQSVLDEKLDEITFESLIAPKTRQKGEA